MKIEEELWKNRGYVVTARNEKGYLQGWIKSDRPVEFYANRYKRFGSFKEGVRREVLKKTVEYTDFKRKSVSGTKFQVVIEGYVNGKKVSTRSVQRSGSSYNKMLEEAEEGFRRAVLMTYYNDSDPSISSAEEENLFDKILKRRKEGIVYYKSR